MNKTQHTKYKTMAILLVGCALAFSTTATARDADNLRASSLSGGARYHAEHSQFKDLPFDRGDVSYLLAYQYTQGFAIWQLACDFAPDVKGKREILSGTTTDAVKVDYVITPQMNLIIQDGVFRGGGGIRTSYIRDEKGDNEWLSLYWQLQLGICIPLGSRLSLDVAAYYVYENWDKLVDFRFGDLEYGALLNFSF